MSHAILHEITLLTLTCCNCGVAFAMHDPIIARLKRDGASTSSGPDQS
ncbi:hypothetical protein AB3X91_16090 [Paraburkholderia sp. BR14263]